MGFRKPRSDSKLENLPEEQHDQLVSWLMGGLSYKKALLLLEKAPFYIETSDRALSEFYDKYCSQALLERRQRAARLAMGVRKEMEARPADFDAATIELLSRWAFEMASANTLDPKSVKSIMTLLLKRRDQDAKAKTLEFEKEKFRASLMSKIETAMEALFAEIKDNAKALEAFNAMKAALAK